MDLVAGLQAAIGLVTALLGRERGAGVPEVGVSLVESGVIGLTNVLANLLASGDEPRRWGNAHPDIVPYQSFAARDGHLVVAVGNDEQFARLMEVLGLPADPRFATNPLRLANREDLLALLAARIGERSRDELVAALEAAGVPAGPVNRVSEALAAMEAAHAGRWLQAAGELRLAPGPILLSGAHPPLRSPPPRLGEHTEEILGEAGLAPDEIARLRRDGVILSI